MPDKPISASGYRPEMVLRVRAACLYAATVLGDLMSEITVVGGLVPSLLIPKAKKSADSQPHVGTMDLDVGLALGLLEHERYRTLSERLKRAGFAPDENEKGHITRQRWFIEGKGHGKVTIDFLIPPSRSGDVGGKIRNIEKDFAALIAPGLHLAFQDRVQVALRGRTIHGETANRKVWICGAGAFVILKALAFEARGEYKDAYDLFYVLRNFGRGVEDVITRLRPLLDDDYTRQAIKILRRDFSAPDALGPRRVAMFLYGKQDEALQADVVGFVGGLLQKCVQKNA
jgi:hypothetical protein